MATFFVVADDCHHKNVGLFSCRIRGSKTVIGSSKTFYHTCLQVKKKRCKRLNIFFSMCLCVNIGMPIEYMVSAWLTLYTCCCGEKTVYPVREGGKRELFEWRVCFPLSQSVRLVESFSLNQPFFIDGRAFMFSLCLFSFHRVSVFTCQRRGNWCVTSRKFDQLQQERPRS